MSALSAIGANGAFAQSFDLGGMSYYASFGGLGGSYQQSMTLPNGYAFSSSFGGTGGLPGMDRGGILRLLRGRFGHHHHHHHHHGWGERHGGFRGSGRLCNEQGRLGIAQLLQGFSGGSRATYANGFPTQAPQAIPRALPIQQGPVQLPTQSPVQSPI